MGVVMLLQRGEKCGALTGCAFSLQKETSSFTDYSVYISSWTEWTVIKEDSHLAIAGG